jgi:hypothetical protein
MKDLANVALSAQTPWWDQPRTKTPSDPDKLSDHYGPMYEEAIEEVHAALADGEWHTLKEVKRIARRHKLGGYASLLDRAGVYFDTEANECVWAKKAKAS